MQVMALSKNFSSYLVNKIDKINTSGVRHTINATNSVISDAELDSHANSPVVGNYAYILDITNKTALDQNLQQS